MPEPISETVDTAMEAVAVANVKTVAEMAAWSTAQVMASHAQAVSNAVSHQKRLDILAEQYLAKAMKGADEVDPSEAAATLKLLTGNDLANTMSALGTAIAQIQQLVKGAQTTPPVTTG